MPNQERRRIVDYAEETVHTGWRKLYCWTQRAGATAWVKRNTRRRERREGRVDTAERVREVRDDA